MPTIRESIEMYNNISRRLNDISFPIDTYNRIINSFNFYDYDEIMNPIISRLESYHNQIQTMIVNFPTLFENQGECEFIDDTFVESVRENIDLTCDILSNQEQSQETSGITSTLQEIKLKLKSIKPELILQTLALIVTILMYISSQVSNSKSQQSTEQLINAVNNVAHAIESLSIENTGDTVQLDMNDN